MPAKIKNIEGYIKNKIVENNGCWEYQGTLNSKGYGMIEIMGKGLRVHRVMWELKNGTIPEDKQLNHTCDNRRCCNPEHLYLGTQLENVRDRQQRGRWKPNNIKGESIGTSKLTEKEVIEIRKEHKEGKTVYKLAKERNMSYPCIWNLVNHKTWKHINSLTDL